jgi:hypothetical protein
VLHAARLRATEILRHAIERMEKLVGGAGGAESERSLVECYFPKATPAVLAEILARFLGARLHVQSAEYLCKPDASSAELTASASQLAIGVMRIPPMPGEKLKTQELNFVSNELAQSPVWTDPAGTKMVDPRTVVNMDLFEEQSLDGQATTLIHEAIHHGVVAGRPGLTTPSSETYDPACGDLSLAAALGNADSYALLAKKLGGLPLDADRLFAVKQYLEVLRTTAKIQGNNGSDDLARDAVAAWVRDRSQLPLDLDTRRLLIVEMLYGWLTGDDELGILSILDGSTDAEILLLPTEFGRRTDPTDQKDHFSLLDLQARFTGDNLARLNQLFKRRFPTNPPLVKGLGARPIGNPVVKAAIVSAYNRTQAERKKEVEIAGVVLLMSSGPPIAHDKTFVGTTSLLTVPPPIGKCEFVDGGIECSGLLEEALLNNPGWQSVLCTFHTHPGVALPPKGRLAPSPKDVEHTSGDVGRIGTEHYVVDPWVVHVISTDGQVDELGTTAAVLGVTPPPLPAGMGSTLEVEPTP